MTRDNVLFTVIGLLLGFLAGYILHEAMAARQPARRIPGAVAAETGSAPGIGAPSVGAPGAGAPGMGAPGTGAQSPAAGGQPAPAMAEVQRLRAYVDANPDDARAVRALADLNFEISNWRRAIELYERFLALEPDTIEVITDLGVCYRSVGEAQRALELFRRAYRLDPGYWQARFNEVVVLAFDLGDLDAAASALEPLRAALPDNAEVERLATEIARRREAA